MSEFECVIRNGGAHQRTMQYVLRSVGLLTAWRSAGIILLAAVGLLIGTRALGQGLSALAGTVTDPSGAVVPNARISVTNSATNATRTVESNEGGLYSVTQIPPGTYTIRVEAGGFKPLVMPNVMLPVDETVTLNLLLTVGPVTQSVQVSSSAEAVNTVNASLGAPLQSREIIDLPLNARSIVGVLALQTGVQAEADFLGRENGGEVNGVRNDQNNITLDGVDVNNQVDLDPFNAVLPVTLDSVQEFIVSTAGQGADATRSSGAQIQLITKSGSNSFHGSAYEYYRSRATSARNYFATQSQALIRNIPGASLGGPILKNKLFFFGSYERHSDNSSALSGTDVPTPQFLAGEVRYLRNDGTYGTITDGSGGLLQQISLIPNDTWNSALMGSSGWYQQFAPFSSDTARTSPSAFDAGTNVLLYRFNAPDDSVQSIYIGRLDYNLNDRNTVFGRGTFNRSMTPSSLETLPGFNNGTTSFDDSRGFSAGWNHVFSPSVNNNLTVGLTRPSYYSTGIASSYFDPFIIEGLVNPTGSQGDIRRTWNFAESLSWAHSSHTFQVGANLRFLNNYISSHNIALPAVYHDNANLLVGDFAYPDSPPIARALGPSEFATLTSPGNLAWALSAATGSIAFITDTAQFGPSGTPLAENSPFVRDFLQRNYATFMQDAWRVRPNLTVTLGLNYSIGTPPWEANGLETNWTQNLADRYKQQSDTTNTVMQLPLFATAPAGRANGKPDYYPTPKADFGPRVAVAWAPQWSDGILGIFGRKGGAGVVRAGYTLTYDHVGSHLAYDTAFGASFGLLDSYASPSYALSFDGVGAPQAPRVGPGLTFPRSDFLTVNTPTGSLPVEGSGLGGIQTLGLDPNLATPRIHLVNLTFSKEFGHGWVIETSYVGSFGRDLLGQGDLASPVNIRDPISGQTYDQAMAQMFTQDEFKGVPVSAVSAIPWFENIYPELLPYLENQLGQTFTSSTQAFYALINQGFTPGRNTPVDIDDNWVAIQEGLGQAKLLSPQVAYMGYIASLGASNYNAGQFSLRKRMPGYVLAVNYTLSKSLDDTSAPESFGSRPDYWTQTGLFQDPYYPQHSYARSDFDRRNQVNAYIVADLPIGRGKRFGSHLPAVLNAVIGGWQTSHILTVSSGLPWNFTASARYSVHDYGRDAPCMVQSIPFGLTKQNGSVFMIKGSNADRNQISLDNFETEYPSGPVCRNQAQGPNLFNLDSAVIKNFSLKEHVRIRLRAEAFNTFNHPNFAIPTDQSAGDIDNLGGTLGQITETVGTERVMQFSLRIEF